MTLRLDAQINLPLKFQEDVIKWSELSWMEGQNSKDQRVLISSPPVIKDDTLYLFMNYYQNERENGKNYGYCGYVIKKLNVITGQKYWEIKRKYKEYGSRKVLSQPSFVNGTIEIPLYDESHAIGINTIWYECYPSHITLDRQSGVIIDSNYVDKTDTQIPRLRSFGDEIFVGGSSRPTIFKMEKGYRHMRPWLKEILNTNLDNRGYLIKVDSIKYPKYKYGPLHIRFAKAENDSFWVVMLNKAQNWTDIQVLFSKYDKDMNLDTTYDVSEHIAYPISDAGIYFIDNNYFVCETFFTNIDNKTYKFHEYLFTYNGEFVDSISYTLKPGIDDIIIYGWLRPLVDRVNNRLLMTQSRQDKLSESTYFEMYENTGDTIRRIRRIHVVGARDHFRTNYATMLENGDILLYIEQFTDPGSSADRWFSWILLDGQKMNIVSSTKDEQTLSKKLKLYPNPSSGLVKIANLDSPASVTISNMSGQIVAQLSNIQNEINIEDLPAGMYIFDIRNKEISERHKIVKVE